MRGTIRVGTIASLLRSVIDPAGSHQIAWDAPIERYLSGGSGALAAFAAVLNRSHEFRGYGLALGAGDLVEATVMHEVLAATAAWFQQHEFDVVL